MRMRSSRGARGFLVAVGVAGFVISAITARANIIGSDFQSFNPTSDGLDFVTVQAARELPEGMIVVGGFVDEAWNTLPPAYDSQGRKFTAQDKILSSDLHIGLGLTRGWDIGLNMQNALTENVNSDQLRSYFVQSGLIDWRVNTKFRLSGEKSEGFAVNLLADIPQIENDPFYGGTSSLSYAAELIWETQLERMQWAINAGMNFRNPGSPINAAAYQPVGNEWVASTALNYRFEKSNWAAIGELYAAIPTAGTRYNSTGDLTALEALLGVKYIGFHNFAIHAGGTTELMRGTSSPDFRLYAGVNWYPAKLWGSTKPTPTPAPEPTPAPIKEEDLIMAATPTPAPVATPEPTPEPTPAEPVTSSAKDTSVFDKEPQQQTETFVVRDINFDTGSAVVPDSFNPYLEKLAEYTKKGRPLKRLTIYGHTDSQGSATYNQKLSQHRAEAVKAILVQNYGMEAAKIHPVGMGLSSPIATNETPEGRSRNRRVEFKIERL